MKRKIVFVLTVAMFLTGCSKAPQTVPVATQPRETVAVTQTVPAATTAATTTAAPAPKESRLPETTATAPTAPTVTATVPAPTTPAVTATVPAPTTPAVTTTVPAPTEPPRTTAAPPVQPAPVQPTAPAASLRPTSSATCKDTGSDEIWPGQSNYERDAYEESDPERMAYREYLRRAGNEWFYWIQSEDDCIHMHLGRNYGIPLYTSEEQLLASTWTSSDPSVATVNSCGFVTPVAEGRAVITVSLEGSIRQCTVEVEKEPVKPVTFAEYEQQAHEEAQKIAQWAMSSRFADTDLERIGLAASVVYTQYVRKTGGVYSYNVVNGELIATRIPGYNQPFGTLVSYYSSCAGNTRAMGLVLEYMGFEWYHMNADQETHQWCVVYDVDGKTAFADAAMGGIVGYGHRETEQWLYYDNGSLMPFHS